MSFMPDGWFEFSKQSEIKEIQEDESKRNAALVIGAAFVVLILMVLRKGKK